MPKTTRSGFTFKGWFVDEALTQKWDFALNRVENNMTLYAKWEANPVIEVFDVNFNSNGGSAVTSQVGLSKGAKVTKPLDPSRSGYSFKGWFVDEAMTMPWNFDTDTVAKNTTLYAKWEAKSTDKTLPATGQSSHNILFVGLGLSVAGLLLLKRRRLQK